MKKPFLSAEDFLQIPGATIESFDAVKGIRSFSIDSRKIPASALFIALSGERFDGHDFLAQVVSSGAQALLIERSKLEKAASITNIPKIIVDDSTAALGQIARLWRKKLSAKVISITGSNGKTSTKEMLLTILGSKFKVHGTEYNNNNHIGVPLTILQAPIDAEYIILEHGTNHFGEIGYTAQIAAPDYAIITNIGASHLEFLGSVDGVKKEKMDLLQAAEDNGGLVFINLDDKLLKKESSEFKNVITYGSKSSADVVYKHAGFTKHGNPKVVISDDDKKIETVLPLFGKTNAANVTAAVAIALQSGMSKHELIAGIKKLQPAKRRLVPFHLHKMLAIDDTYNANPQSMLAAFEVLRNIKLYKNRWLILGDMFELGKDAEKMHKALAPYIVKVPNIRVLLIGELMHALYLELKKYYLPVWHAKTREQMIEYINENNFTDSVTLIKGSRGMKMEEFVELIEKLYSK